MTGIAVGVFPDTVYINTRAWESKEWVLSLTGQAPASAFIMEKFKL